MKTPSCIGRRTRGWTLFELLIAVSISAVLAVFAFVGTQRLRGKAEIVKCISNMRQTGAGFYAYGADHNGAFPVQREEGVLPHAASHSWAGQLLPYVGTMYAMQCSKTKSGPHASFLYNAFAAAKPSAMPGVSEVRISKSRTPALDGLLLDYVPTGGGAVTTTSSGNVNWGTNPPENWFPHKKHRNVLFVDGHVETTRALEIRWNWPAL